jgi:hypothetical protein
MFNTKIRNTITSLNARMLSLAAIAAIGATGLAFVSASPASADPSNVRLSPTDCAAKDANGNVVYLPQGTFIQKDGGATTYECVNGQWVVTYVVRYAPPSGGTRPSNAQPTGPSGSPSKSIQTNRFITAGPLI